MSTTVIIEYKTMKKMFYRLSLLLTVLTMLLSACKPSPTPTTISTDTSGTGIIPTATVIDTGLPAVDPGEPLPPSLVEQQPRGGGELPLSGEVVLTFNQPMDMGKTAEAWQMSGPDGKEVQGEITWSSPRTMRFEAGRPLQSGSLYQAGLGTQALSTNGLALVEPLTFEFTTVSELQVSQVFPADGAQEIANNAVITVIFNRPVVPLVIAEERSDLPMPMEFSPDITGSGEWVNTSVFAFQPEKLLRGATTYEVKVKAGLMDAGEETRLSDDFTWEFTTAAPGIQTLEINGEEIDISKRTPNVLLDEYFTVHFLQPMDETSTESALSLVADSGTNVDLTTLWAQDATTLMITPTQQLALGTNYNLVIAEQAQAADGGSLKESLDFKFTTVPSPAIEFVRPANGVTQENYSSELYIKFVSPMRLDTVKDKIVISPKPETEYEWWYNEYDWSVVAFILEPSTRYEVRFLPGMEDLFGNAISQGQTIRFTTGAYPPNAGLQMPYEPALMRVDGPQEFYITYQNTSRVTLELYKISPSEIAGFLSGRTYPYQYNPPAGNLVWRVEETTAGALNQRVLQSYQPVTEDGDPLAAGIYFLGMDAERVYRSERWVDTRLLIVANGNLTFKTTTLDALVWLTDLDSGKPLQDVAATIYDDRFQEIGQGITDGDGLLYLEIPAPKEPYENRFAMTDDGDVFAFASSQWGSGVSMWDYGIWGAYYSPANQPTAYIYTERPIYRPGQPVYFKGIVRLDDDLAYSLPEGEHVDVEITNFQETVYEETLLLSSYGTFSGEFTLDQEAAIGSYSLAISLQGREGVVGSVSFNVAEYRRPEFQVNVVAEPVNVLTGDSFTVEVQADYYSGGGVSDAEVNWTLTSQPFTFVPPDEISNYNFADIEEDVRTFGEEGGPSSKVIAEGTGRTDASGRLALTLPVDLSDTNTSRSLVFEATVTDLSQNAVSGRASLVAHRSAVYPGVRAETYVGITNEEQAFEIVTVDWDGERLAGQMVSVEIVERRWHSVQEQDSNGRIQWTSSVEEIPVTSLTDVETDKDGEARASFTPPNGGVFRAKVTVLDKEGNPASASAFLWVAGEEFIPWRQTNDRSFDLVTDRKRYTPGQTAEILIASPFQGEAYALVTVERGRVHYQEVVLLETNSTIYKLEITPDMAPNAYISVLVVKGVDENNPRPNFKLGISEIQVDREQQALTVKISTDQETAKPGDRVRYTVQVLDFQGEPVKAELSLSLSDLATLSLMPPNSPPILDYFFSRRMLGVWTAVPISLSIEEYNAAISDEVAGGIGGGGGGGKGFGELGVVEVREDFPDTAFWEGHVTTNQDGQATVSVTLPDNLTTWRMDARAVTQETLVGQATLDIVSTKPLLMRPQTPRFFVAGDQATLGAAVHNNTDQSLTVEVSLEAQGLTLVSQASQSVQIAANSQAYVTWQAEVSSEVKRVDLIFRAESSGLADASRPPQGTLDNQGIPVYRFEAPETVATSGQMTEEGTRLEAISLPESFDISQGELTINLSPSLAAGMTDSLEFLRGFPYDCVEQTISRFLPNVLTTRAYISAGLSDPELEANLRKDVQATLQRLTNWQNADGGWGWWRNEKSDPLTSAYVVLGLQEAKESGYPVSDPVLTRGVSYLRNQLASIPRLSSADKLNRQAFLLYVLARVGKPDVSRSVQLYDQRQNMAIYARAFLAQTLHLIDPQDERLPTLLSDLASAAVLSASGSHWEEEQVDRLNWNTDTRTTAIVLSALSQLDTENPLNANAVRWLMSHRTNGHWLGTQETAWTLMALTNWMVASGELDADYQYAVTLNNERLGGGAANAETLRQNYVLRVDVADMLSQEVNRLVIARDEGPGNLYYTAHLNVSLPVEGIQALDQGIVVSRSYYRLDDLQNPISEASQGELFLARLTLVAPSALHYVVVDDPLPAGVESVDQSLSTSPQSLEVPQEAPQQYSWEDLFWRGWGWWHFDHIQLRDEKVVLSADYLPAGTYVYTYLVRAFTVGLFKIIPPTAWEFYFPEVYGRGDGSLFTIIP